MTWFAESGVVPAWYSRVTMPDDTDIEIPPVSPKILARRRKKVRELCQDFVGVRIEGRDAHVLSTRLSRAFTPSQNEFEREGGELSTRLDLPFRETVFAAVAGKVLDEKRVSLLSHRIAGNLEEIRTGRPILNWMSQKGEEWVLLGVRDSEYAARGKSRGAALQLGVFSGSPAGMVFVQYFPDFILNRMAIQLGLKAIYDDRTVHFREFVGTFFMGIPARGVELSLIRFGVRPNLVNMNKELAALRAPGRVCPANYRHPCSRCPIGYDRCRAGMHPTTLFYMNCAGLTHGCGDGERSGWFDPRGKGWQYCATCPNRGTLPSGYAWQAYTPLSRFEEFFGAGPET